MTQANRSFKQHHFVSLFMLAVIFVYIMSINFLMPLMADDYWYSMNWEQTKHIEGLNDILTFQIHHYFEWGGRNVAQTLTQLNLYFGKPLFNVLNTFVFLIFLLLIYWHSQGECTMRLNPLLLSLVILFAWFCLPTIGETVFWLIGSCNYLWTLVLILLFLLPYRLKLAGHPVFKSHNSFLTALGMFVLGIIAGWTNENTGLMMVIAVIGVTFYFRKNQMTEKWIVAGMCGAILGYVIMVAAPGNYVRIATATRGAHYSFLNNHVIDVLKTIGTLTLHQLPLYIVLIIIMKKMFHNYAGIKASMREWTLEDKSVITYSAIYIALSFLGLMAMVGSPTFPQRAGMGAAAFLIIGVINLFRLQIIRDAFLTKGKKIIIAFICFALIPTAFMAFKDYQTIHRENQQRVNYIVQCKNEGIENIQVEPFSIKDRSVLGIVIVNDIGKNPEKFRSKYYAHYFGVKSMSLR